MLGCGGFVVGFRFSHGRLAGRRRVHGHGGGAGVRGGQDLAAPDHGPRFRTWPVSTADFNEGKEATGDSLRADLIRHEAFKKEFTFGQ